MDVTPGNGAVTFIIFGLWTGSVSDADPSKPSDEATSFSDDEPEK